MDGIKLSMLAKYGTGLTCLMLLIIGVMTWFIKYPETVTSRAKLTGSNAPKPLIAKQNARLIKLNKKNGDLVAKGEIIGCIETTAQVDEVQRLSMFLDTLYVYVQKDSLSLIKELMKMNYTHLGELQGDYQAFIQSYLPYKDYILGDYVKRRRNLLNKDFSIAQQSREVLQDQKELNELDMSLSQTTLDKNKKLLDERLISEQEYRDLTSQNIGKRMLEPQMRSSYISNETQKNAIQKELLELDNQVATQRALFQQSVFNLISRTEEWKNNHLLVASTNGKVAFTSFLQENQSLKAGEVVGYIIPLTSEVYVETFIPQTNFGKVKKGQRVLLKFDAYPWQEFGVVVGHVEYISPIPVDSGYYLARVTLPNDLRSNYNKKIPFIEGLLAQSEIVTKDIRLAESFYYDLLKQVKK